MTARHSVPLAERLRLIVILDTDAVGDRDLMEIARAGLRGGVPAFQLRAKTRSARDMLELARTLVPELNAAGALFFVNDRMDVALSAGADGVHLGNDDLPLGAARIIAPPGFLVGRSVDNVDEARAAERDGADYVGAGPVYRTRSKADAGEIIHPDGIAAIASAVHIPVVGIGGIEIASARAVVEAGAAGVAVIGAVLGSVDPEAATRALMREITSSGTSPI